MRKRSETRRRFGKVKERTEFIVAKRVSRAALQAAHSLGIALPTHRPHREDSAAAVEHVLTPLWIHFLYSIFRANNANINFREKEKKVLDQILGAGKYDARIRPSGINGTGEWSFCTPPRSLASLNS